MSFEGKPEVVESSGSSRTAPEFGLDVEQVHNSVEKDVLHGKQFLMQCGDSKDSVWSHLQDLLRKILSERPENVIDYLEEYSKDLKEERFSLQNDHLRDVYVSPQLFDYAQKRIEFLKTIGSVKNEGEELPAEVQEDDEEGKSVRKMGFMEQMNLFRDAGISLSADECFIINIALRKLSQTQPLKSIRFWGKIFGLKKNYIIAECEFTDEEQTRILEEQAAEEERLEQERREREEAENEEAERKREEEQRIREEEERKRQEEKELAAGEEGEIPLPPLRERYKMPKIPTPPEIIEVVIPKENVGDGVNKKIYFVCNEPGDEWVMLPYVTPKQIAISRKIKKYFTGDLSHEMLTYPLFPGTEKDYLRCQIARISAGTQISPLGFYTFSIPGEEEEEVGEEEEEGVKTSYVENPEFEPLPMKDLTDPAMSFWVHHSLNILKQGRTKWWSSKVGTGEEEEGEGGEEEEEEGQEEPEEPEVGPPLLTPLSEDVSLETTAPWTARVSSEYTPENAMALVSSNLWPGAYAFAVGKVFGNVYIGWGHKYMGQGFSPEPLPFPEMEYEGGPEIMEIDDPTPEAEEEWRLAHEKKPPKGEEGEEEEEEENEDEEEEADD